MAHNLGPQKVLVTPVNTVAVPEEPYSVSELQTIFGPTGLVSTFYLANSYGRYGPYNGLVLPYQSNPVAVPYDCSALSTLWSYGYERSMAMLGTTYYSYWPKVTAMPALNCGTVGAGAGDTLKVQGRFPISVAIHEIGHTLGLPHAKGQQWDNGTLIVAPYGDMYSTMGDSNQGLAQFSGIDKQTLGWLDMAGTPRSQSVTITGDYALDAFEQPVSSTGIVMLRVTVPNQPLLTIEARVNGDKNGNWPGVILRSGTSGQTVLLNTGPANQDRWYLPVGQSYIYGVATITALAFSAAGAVIRVTLPGSVTLPPPSNPRAQ